LFNQLTVINFNYCDLSLSPGKIKARLIKGHLPTNKIWIPSEGLSIRDKQKEIIISVAEWEVLRLCDLENFKQREAADFMKLSQPTVNRLLTKAHTKIVQALNNGYILKFEHESLVECPNCLGQLSTKVSNSIECPNCNKIIDTT